jgi:hypothetical protein
MTEPDNPSGAEADDDASESGPASHDPMTALIKRSFAASPAAPSTVAPPSILRGVQRRIRRRSRGRFFADGWSTSDGRVSPLLVAAAMLLVLIVAYFALGPVGVQ